MTTVSWPSVARDMPPLTSKQKWLALVQRRCPRCGQGKIYQSGMTMNSRCPVCDLLYEREPGYFLGSLYISYGISCALLMLGLLAAYLLFPHFDLGWLVLILGVLYLPFVPLVTRYSRVLWIYFDRWAWPSPPGSSD
jgi:uncharacterized protein (DUF983 family)